MPESECVRVSGTSALTGTAFKIASNGSVPPTAAQSHPINHSDDSTNTSSVGAGAILLLLLLAIILLLRQTHRLVPVILACMALLVATD